MFTWNTLLKLLESFATLFSRKVKLFIYPTLRKGIIWNTTKFWLPPHLIDLFQYLIANDKIEDITDYNSNNLNVETDKVLHFIKQGAEGWEEFVPVEVATIIKERCLFGYSCETSTSSGEELQ